MKTLPECFLEADEYNSSNLIVNIPQKAPKGAIIRGQDTAISLFQRALKYHEFWIQPGHTLGANYNNVSVTISHKETEREELFEYLWENRDRYTAISLLPFDDFKYNQAPFESITEEEFTSMVNELPEFDLSNILEDSDNTDRQSIIACSGNQCELHI